jgi:hypothetical protein
MATAKRGSAVRVGAGTGVPVRRDKAGAGCRGVATVTTGLRRGRAATRKMGRRSLDL